MEFVHVYAMGMSLLLHYIASLSLHLTLIRHQASLDAMSRGHMIADMVAIIGRLKHCRGITY